MILFIYSTVLHRYFVLIPTVGNFTTQNHSSSSLHYHKVYHIIFITHGRGWLKKDHETIALNEHDVVIIHPDEKHIFTSDFEEGVTYFSFNFYLMDDISPNFSAELEKNWDNLEYFESHAVSLAMNEIFPFVIKEGKVDYDHAQWPLLSAFIVSINDYFKDFSLRKPVTQEEINRQRYGILNFSSQKLVELSNILEQKKNADLSAKESRLLQGVLDYLDTHFMQKFSLDILAQQMAYSPIYLCRFFKEKTGFTLGEYVGKLRINKGCEYLRATDWSIGLIAEKLGYSSPNHFSKNFKMATGLSPKDYRKVKE